MALTRRGFLKSLLAAASMSLARHIAPAALTRPELVTPPPSAKLLIDRMIAAIDRIKHLRGDAPPVFWMNRRCYDACIAAGLDPAMPPDACIEIANEELDDDGAITFWDRQHTRRIHDLGTFEELQRTPAPEARWPRRTVLIDNDGVHELYQHTPLTFPDREEHVAAIRADYFSRKS